MSENLTHNKKILSRIEKWDTPPYFLHTVLLKSLPFVLQLGICFPEFLLVEDFDVSNGPNCMVELQSSIYHFNEILMCLIKYI